MCDDRRVHVTDHTCIIQNKRLFLVIFLCLNQNIHVDKMTKFISKVHISAILRIGCNLRVNNRSQTFQLATLLMNTIYMYVSAVTP